MLLRLQGNINDTFTNPLQMDWNDIIFCNEGGKQNMSLSAKNIPPMVSGAIPAEIQIRNTIDSELYFKIRSYDPLCFLNAACVNESPLFRFQLIYDGYEFLYYPEFKLYERPYLVLERNYSIGSDTLLFSGLVSSTHDNADNLPLIEAGAIITFLDTGDSYTITEKEVIGSDTAMILNIPLTANHLINDVVVIETAKYEYKTNSNIMKPTTTTSVFKFKFVNPNNLTAKDWAITINDQMEDDFSTLINNDFTSITDLWGDDKIVSLSSDMAIEESTVIMNIDIDTSDNEIEFATTVASLLQVNSYFTLKSSTAIEILKVAEILSPIRVRVLRAQLGTTSSDFTSAGTTLFFPKYFYFQMLPVNNYIDFRYIVYRNIDFVLTWV